MLDIHLAFERRGRGRPLVLIHGYPLDRTIWREVAPLLEDRFDLILPDLRGFGESEATEAVHSMDDFASDIVRLLDHLGIEKAFVAGHSMGGYVSLALAHAHPQRLLGLGLIASQAAADSPERKAGRYQSAAEIAEKGMEVVIESMPARLSADPRVQAFAKEVIARQSAAGAIGALRAMAERADARSLLQGLEIPVVIVHGDADVLIPVERAREMKAALPSAHYLELHGLGHMPMLENPQALAEALSVFLSTGEK